MLRAFALVSALPIFLLLAGCNAGGGTNQGCQDTIMEEKINEIETIKNTANAKDEVVSLGDTVQLLNRRDRDGKCVTNPASWVSDRNSDCANDIFITLRHKGLACQNHGDWVDLVRPAQPPALPEENIIVRITVKNRRWNGASREARREGKEAVARIALQKKVTRENDDGTTEERCEPAEWHIEIKSGYIFENVVDFVAKTMEVVHPSYNQCTPSACRDAEAINDLARVPAEWTGTCVASPPPSFPPPQTQFRFPLHPRLLCRATERGAELLYPAESSACGMETVALALDFVPGLLEREDAVQNALEDDMLVSRFPLNRISSILGFTSIFTPDIGVDPCPLLDWHAELRGPASLEPVVRLVTERMEATYGPCAF